MTFYHGSFKKFDIGFVLKSQNTYTSNYNSKKLEELMELLKPQHLLSRYKSLFLTDDPDMIDNCGGYTDYIYSIKSDNLIVEMSDLSWYSEASSHLENGLIEEAEKCVKNYWSGVVNHSNSSCIEYRTTDATIHAIHEINVL